MSFGAEQEAHRARAIAESFGADPERYHRTRPRYPDALVQRILAGLPGREILDVGTGTGIAARQFAAAGCRVLGVEVDGRMAAFARRSGLQVEVARFEEWERAGRTFDAVVAGQTWHWIDPSAGAARAADALRPGGRLAVFWNVQQPPAVVADAFAEVYRRLLPGTPFARGVGGGASSYSPLLARAAGGIRDTGAFAEPEQWQVDWEHRYTRDEWLDQVPTSGGHGLFPADTLSQLLAALGAAIDAAGGSFVTRYAAVAITAVRSPQSRSVRLTHQTLGLPLRLRVYKGHRSHQPRRRHGRPGAASEG